MHRCAVCVCLSDTTLPFGVETEAGISCEFGRLSTIELVYAVVVISLGVFLLTSSDLLPRKETGCLVPEYCGKGIQLEYRGVSPLPFSY